MYKGHPFASKVLERIQKQKLLQLHRQNIRQVRPCTDFNDSSQNFYTLNPKKKQMQKETKCTEIERQNRLLLQKITHIMGKKRNSSEQKMNRSLNSNFRKKQYQSIEVQNAKMLKRLQQRKSDYQLGKFKKQWKKNKAMMQNITSYPLIIDPTITRRKKKSINMHSEDLRKIANTNPEDFQIVKLRLIGTKKFVVTLKLTKDKLIIIGDLRAEKQLKVIEIEKEQGLKFIEDNCMGDVAKLFDCLRYDEGDKSLYLIADDNIDRNKQAVSAKQINSRDQNRIKPRQKRQMSHKPIYEGVDFGILQREELIF